MYKKSSSIPTVAIVGKPNVGKSSLFNRLIHRRKAIVAPEPGVTRDINFEPLDFGGTRVNLADSAGFTQGLNDIHTASQLLNQRLVQEASLIVFTCDIRELSAEDFEIAELVRKSGKPAILVLNKADNSIVLENQYDFYTLGFENPIPVSALHGTNISLLREKIEERIEKTMGGPAQIISDRKSRAIDVAIIGKPNVGKSSLLNLLVEMERSLVTPLPGTTRDSVDQILHYEGYTINLIDTAGLRTRRSIRENVEYYSLVRTKEAIKKSTISLLLIDACKGITSQDKKIADIVVGEKKALIIGANKWDLVTPNETEFIQDIYYYFPHIAFADVIPLSAKIGYNKIILLKNILKVYNNYYKSVKTSQLNDFLGTLSLNRAAIKYGVQKKTGPPEFEFFVRHIEGSGTNFKRYLINAVRKRFHFEGVPVSVTLKKR